MKAKRLLLVSLKEDQKLIKRLQHANCVVMSARDGASALTYAKHLALDAVILISTGEAMGRTETALNLRDIRPFSEIIFVTRDPARPTESETAARAIPHTRVMTVDEVADYFASSTSESPARG